MQVTKSTIFQLFQTEQRHLVPLFQRPYVWNEEGQWTPLWENIRDKADEMVAYETNRSQKRPSLHFLGAVVRNPMQTMGLHVQANLLIDGQQRLTTLQIVLFALRDYVKANPVHSDARYLGLLDMLTKNRTANDDTNKEQYKVWPTNVNRKTFEKVAEAGTPDAVLEAFPVERIRRVRLTSRYTMRPPLALAYLFFYQKIAEYVEGSEANDAIDNTDETSAKRLEALLVTLQNHMEIVIIDLERDEDPQTIFETLNARGVPLLPSDLVRNFVFSEAGRTTLDSDVLHKNYWQTYDGEFWSQTEAQGRVSRPRLDLFLFRYLVYQTRSEASITELFNEFRNWWQKEPRNVESELQKMQHFSNVYHDLIAPSGHDRFSLFVRRVRVMDAGTVYPLLLFLKGETPTPLSSFDLDIVAAYLESYLVRRMVCGLTTKNYNNVFLGLLKHLADTQNVTSDSIAEQLNASNRDTSRWPDDAEFKAAWLTRPAYRVLSQSRAEMVLRALDLLLTTTKQIQVQITGQVTIEHVMPQKGSAADWPLDVDTNGLTDAEAASTTEKAQQERNNLIHTFGNLTLLTQALNSSVSNGPYSQKQPAIVFNATSRLNTYFNTAGSVWDEAAIRTRGEKLFETALKIWPKP